MNPVEAAKLVCASYRMFDDDHHELFYPELDASVSDDWQLIGHLTALDALLNAQAIGIGERVWFGFVAQSRHDPSEYAVVIRGTQTGLEWLIDSEGTIGFASIYDSMRLGLGNLHAASDIADAISAPATVTVVGHSLGAALATYLTADLVTHVELGTHVKGIFLASPKPGDADFARKFDAVVGQDNYDSFAYLLDLVPHAPPSILGFRQLPKHTLLRPEESAAKIPFDLHLNHAADSYLALLQTRSIQ